MAGCPRGYKARDPKASKRASLACGHAVVEGLGLWVWGLADKLARRLGEAEEPRGVGNKGGVVLRGPINYNLPGSSVHGIL